MTLVKKLTYGGKSVKALVKDPSEHQQKCWMAGNFYEVQRHGVLNHIFREHRNKVIMDVGASIGNHTLFFSAICGSPAVLSIEPYFPSYQHLMENIELNGLQSTVTALNVAAGDKEGSNVIVSPYGAGGNIGMVAITEKETENSNSVPYTTLDWALESVDFPVPHVVKIDVEHHNIQVLRGMRRILATGPAIYIEAESKAQFAEVQGFLMDFGYRYTGNKFNHTPTYEFRKR